MKLLSDTMATSPVKIVIKSWKTVSRDIINRCNPEAEKNISTTTITKDKKITREIMAGWIIELLNAGNDLAGQSDHQFREKMDLVEKCDKTSDICTKLQKLDTNIEKQFKAQTGLIENLQKQVNSKFKSYADALTSQADKITHSVKSVYDKQDRRNNLVVYGLERYPNNTLEKDVESMLVETYVKFDPEDIWMTEIKSNVGGLPIIKLQFRKREVAEEILKNAYKLKYISDFRKVYLSKDLTSAELVKRKELVIELKRRITNEPKTRWIIKGEKIVAKGEFKRLIRSDSEDSD